MHAQTAWEYRGRVSPTTISGPQMPTDYTHTWHQSMTAPYPQHNHTRHRSVQNHHSKLALDYLDLSAQMEHQRHQSNQVNLAPRLANHPFPARPPALQTHNSNLVYSDEDDENDAENFAGNNPVDLANMTAAERIAQKRRMKRFRLTHSQTRFLINEFIHQPHPEAAHREWLSQKIPGLSPRQVQVWFQNRRAKMKRLSPEDRERVLRSRSLGDDFDGTEDLLASPTDADKQPDWMRKPTTAIATQSDLKEIFVHGIDSIKNHESKQVSFGIESICSQTAYPSPPATSERSFPVHPPLHRRVTIQLPTASSVNDDEEDFRDRFSGSHDHRLYGDRRPSRRQTTYLFGHEVIVSPSDEDEDMDHEHAMTDEPFGIRRELHN